MKPAGGSGGRGLVPGGPVFSPIGQCGALLSNTMHEFAPVLADQFPIDEIFDVFFSSCLLGVRKPETAIFRQALDELEVRPERTLFLDDNPVCIEGARAAGLDVILVDDVNRALASLRIAIG